MSSADRAHPPGGLDQEPELTSARDQQKASTLGLTSATGLVVGTVVGAGVFTMPAVLASAGTVSRSVPEVLVEKARDDRKGFLRLGQADVGEETVAHSVPDVQVGRDAGVHQESIGPLPVTLVEE